MDCALIDTSIIQINRFVCTQEKVIFIQNQEIVFTPIIQATNGFVIADTIHSDRVIGPVRKGSPPCRKAVIRCIDGVLVIIYITAGVDNDRGPWRALGSDFPINGGFNIRVGYHQTKGNSQNSGIAVKRIGC